MAEAKTLFRNVKWLDEPFSRRVLARDLAWQLMAPARRSHVGRSESTDALEFRATAAAIASVSNALQGIRIALLLNCFVDHFFSVLLKYGLVLHVFHDNSTVKVQVTLKN